MPSKLSSIAIRQVITELFHRLAGKVFRIAAAGKVFEKIQGIRFWYLQYAACTNFATGKSKCHGFVQNEMWREWPDILVSGHGKECCSHSQTRQVSQIHGKQSGHSESDNSQTSPWTRHSIAREIRNSALCIKRSEHGSYSRGWKPEVKHNKADATHVSDEKVQNQQGEKERQCLSVKERTSVLLWLTASLKFRFTHVYIHVF